MMHIIKPIMESIATLIQMLKTDILIIQNDDEKRKHAAQRKNISHDLHKLVSTLMQIRKLDLHHVDEFINAEQDIKIIENFLAKYHDRKKDTRGDSKK